MTNSTPARKILRVLVIDDNRDAADSLAMLVRVWGHEAHVAYDGAVGLEVARELRPEVVFLDLALPLMNGYDVAEHLRGQGGPGDPVLVAVTGYADDAHRARSRHAGFDHFLAKPVEPDVLERLLGAHARFDTISEEAPSSAAGLGRRETKVELPRRQTKLRKGP